MNSSAIISSLLAFGPQIEFSFQDVLADLRQELINNPRLSGFHSAVKHLPGFWKTLIDSDSTLDPVPGAEYLGHLRRWVVDGGLFPHHLGKITNVYALPITVILQITQYFRYLSWLGVDDAHGVVLEGLESDGIQGFCLGFLSALAVSSSEQEADIGPVATISLRLAVSIGAYVDQDGVFAEPPNEMACAAIRWRGENVSKRDELTDLIRTYPDVRSRDPV